MYWYVPFIIIFYNFSLPLTTKIKPFKLGILAISFYQNTRLCLKTAQRMRCNVTLQKENDSSLDARGFSCVVSSVGHVSTYRLSESPF